MATQPSARQALYDPTIEPVNDNGKTYHVRVVSGAERQAFVDYSRAEGHTPIEVYSHLLTRALCDDTGSRLFTDDEQDQVAAIPWKRLSALFDAAFKLNSLNAGAVDQEKKD